MKNRLKKADMMLLLAVFAILIIILLCSFAFETKKGSLVKVTVDGTLYGEYPLDENQTVEIRLDGEVANVLTVQNGSADMKDATCPDKLCVHQKAISRSKETFVCLPHKVVVEITGEEPAKLDAVAH